MRPLEGAIQLLKASVGPSVSLTSTKMALALSSGGVLA